MKKLISITLINILFLTNIPLGTVEAYGQVWSGKGKSLSREELAERLQNFELSEADFRRQSVPVAMSTAVNKVYAAVELDGEEVSELVNPSALMSYEDFVTWQKGNKAAYERSAEYKKAKAKLELDIRGMLSAGKSAVEIEAELGLVGSEEEEEAALKRAYAEYESIVKAEEEEVRAARWYLTEGKWDYKEAWRKEREILQKYADDESLEWSHEDYIYIRKYTQALLGYVKEDVVNRAPRVMGELLSLYKTGVHSEYEHKKGSEEIRELVSAGSAAWCNGKMLEGKEKSKEKAANCAKVSEGAVIIGIIGSPLAGVRGEKEGSEEYLQKYMEEYYDSLAGANVIVNSTAGLLNLGERGVRRLKNVLLNLANKEEIESTKGVFSRGMVGMLAEVGIVGAKGFSDERTIVNGGYYLDGVSKVGSYVDKDLANNREHLINGGAWLEHVLVSNAWEDVGRMIADYEGVDGKGCKECAEVISYAVSKSVSKWGEATTVAGNIPFLVGAAQGSKNIKSSDKQKIADGIFGLSFTDLNAANNLALDKKLAYIKGIDAAVYAKGYDIRGKQKSYERSGRIMSGAGVADIVLSVGFAASLARGAVSGARSWVSMFRQASKLKGLGRVPSVRAGISRITVQNLRRAHAQTLLKAPAGRVIPGTERAVNLHNKEISGMKVSVKGAAHNYQNTGSLPKKITPPVRTRATGLKVLEEKPELVAKGNGYNVRKLNDKTLILDLGQRMPGVQPRATGTLTAQAGEGSGGSANSAGPGISTGNVSKYDLLMEVKSTMPKYEPTTVRQPTFRDKFNHVMWQTKMRAAMLSTPVGTTGAVAEGALVTPTQIVSQSKAPASLFDIVESADAARPQRFIGKGTTLVKPQVSALPKSSSAPKTNLLNVGTNRGRGNYHISTPAVTVMAAGYNPLTGRAPYKPTETIHAYANITTPTINYKSDIEALASNKQLNAIITARQSEQGGDVQAEELAGEIVSANAGIRGRVGQIITSTPFKVAASVAALTTLAGAAAGLFAPEAAEGVNAIINNTPDLLPAINEALPAVNEIPAIAENIITIGGVSTSIVLPFFKVKKNSLDDFSVNIENDLNGYVNSDSKSRVAMIERIESDLRDVKREIATTLADEVKSNTEYIDSYTEELNKKKIHNEEKADMIKTLERSEVSETKLAAKYKELSISLHEQNIINDRLSDVQNRKDFYEAYTEYYKALDFYLQAKIDFLNNKIALNELKNAAIYLNKQVNNLLNLTSIIVLKNHSILHEAKEARKSSEKDLDIYNFINSRFENRNSRTSAWELLEEVALASKNKVQAEITILSALSIGDAAYIKEAVSSSFASEFDSVYSILDGAVKVVKPYVDGRQAIANDSKILGVKLNKIFISAYNNILKIFTGKENSFYKNTLRSNINNVVAKLTLSTSDKEKIMNLASAYLDEKTFISDIVMDKVSGFEFDAAYRAANIYMDEDLASVVQGVKEEALASAIEQYTNDKKTTLKKKWYSRLLNGRKINRENNIKFTEIFNEKLYVEVNKLDLKRSEKQSILKSLMKDAEGVIFKAPKVKINKSANKLKKSYSTKATSDQMEVKKFKIKEGGELMELSGVTFKVDPRLNVKSDDLIWGKEGDKYILYRTVDGRTDALTQWYMEIEARGMEALAIASVEKNTKKITVKLIDDRTYSPINTLRGKTNRVISDLSEEGDEKGYPLYVKIDGEEVASNILVELDPSFEFSQIDRILIEDGKVYAVTGRSNKTLITTAQFRLPKNKLAEFVSLIKSINGSAKNLDVLVRYNRNKLEGLYWGSLTSYSSAVRNLIGILKDGMDLSQAMIQILPMAAYIPNLLADRYRKWAARYGNDKILKVGLWTTLGVGIMSGVMAFTGMLNDPENKIGFWGAVIASLGFGLGSSLQQQTTKDFVSKHSMTSEHNSANNAEWQLYKQYGGMFIALPYVAIKLAVEWVSKFWGNGINIEQDLGVLPLHFIYPVVVATTLYAIYKVYFAGYKEPKKAEGEKKAKLKTSDLRSELKRLGVLDKLRKNIYSTSFSVAGQQAMDAIFLFLMTTTAYDLLGKSGGTAITFFATMLPAIIARKIAKKLVRKKVVSDDEILTLSGPLGIAGILGFIFTYDISPVIASLFVAMATLGLANYQAQSMGVIEKTIYSEVDKEIKALKSGEDSGASEEMKKHYLNSKEAKDLFSPYVSALFNRQMSGVGFLTFISALVGTVLLKMFISSANPEISDAQLKSLEMTSQLYSAFVAVALVLVGIFLQYSYMRKVIKDVKSVRGYKGALSQDFDVSRKVINSARRRKLPQVDPHDWVRETSKPQ
ncbi:hypothetical protein Dip518_000100 [Parelusimicrobium proximum]|uniref:hypothetical protein n=1 Tax=Parelusimicrobium proximum TaxID=3228953 RepID=UPI003D1697EC